MIAILEQSFGGMKEAGIKFEESKTGKLLAFKKEAGEYRCLIENFLVMFMKLQKKRIKRKSSLFGFYNSSEKHWVFVEADKLGSDAASQFFPNFKTAIEIPQDQQEIEDL